MKMKMFKVEGLSCRNGAVWFARTIHAANEQNALKEARTECALANIDPDDLEFDIWEVDEEKLANILKLGN